MMPTEPKRWLLVCRRPPYGNALAREAIDVALAAAAFEQPVTLLFMGDGVWQLRRGQEGATIGQKDIDRQLIALPLYDVSAIYIDEEALSARGMATAELALPVTALNVTGIRELFARHDVVLNF